MSLRMRIYSVAMSGPTLKSQSSRRWVHELLLRLRFKLDNREMAMTRNHIWLPRYGMSLRIRIHSVALSGHVEMTEFGRERTP